jgi:hypothetical protein
MKCPICIKNCMYRLPLPHYFITRPCCYNYLSILWNDQASPSTMLPQSKRNAHFQVISSCYNFLVCTILQTKANPLLTFLYRVTSSQLNIYDECGQHTHTPQMSQGTAQSAQSRMNHLRELPCLRHVQTNTSSNLN